MKKLFAIIVSVAAVFTLYAVTATAEYCKLVLGYHFDGDSTDRVIDSGRNGLDARIEPFDANGTWVESPEHKPGKVEKALDFDGKQMLKVDHHDSIIMKNFTLMSWVWYTWDYYPNSNEGRQEIMEKFGAFWMNIRRDSKKLRVGFPNSDCVKNNKDKEVYNIGRWDSSKVIPEKEWTHVAATFDFDSKSVAIYINGVKDANVKELISLNDRPCPSIHPLVIGGRYAKNETCAACPDAFFKGRIDEVRIFSEALTLDQIKYLMSSTKPFVPAPKPCVSLDLLYTPVTPCRIVDTRKAGGAIQPGGIRSYNVRGAVASQGGNPAGCQSPKGEPRAVHINVTSVPLGNGWITAYPFGSAAPTASIVNYRSDAQNVANSGTVKTCFNCSKDINIKSGGGKTHVIIDVLGYYYKP